MGKDYIPPQEIPFKEWQMNFMNIIEANAPAWSIPASAITELEAQKTAYENAYEAANIGKKNNCTKQQIKAKEDAPAIYKSEIRLFVKR